MSDQTTELGTGKRARPTAARKGSAPASSTARADAEPERRAPQRAPGRRRVDAILDAASAILVEDGIAGLTMDAIVKRSGTSKSSLYHFFRDLDCVMDALLDRHALTVSAIGEASATEVVEWGSLSLDETVERFLAPMAHYVTAHPDFLLLIRARGGCNERAMHCTQGEALMIERAEQILLARTPHIPAAERRARATMMFAAVIGTMEIAGRVQVPSRAELMEQARQMLVAYMAAAEAG